MSTATIARADADGLPAPIEDLLDAAAEAGALTFAEVRTALDEAGVGPVEAKRVITAIRRRGITIGADAPGSAPTATPVVEEDEVDDTWDHEVPTTDLVRVYLTDIGRVALLTAEQEVDLARRIEAGLYAAEKLRQADAKEIAKIPVKMRRDLAAGRRRRWPGPQPPARGQPAPRRLPRQALPGQGPDAARPDPGRQHRPGPRGREVRLHQGLQVLDVRDLVDPPGAAARDRRPGPHHPGARAHGRADQQGAAGQA